MYGAGLRLMECLRLRVKDIDCNTRQIVVREGKGDKDRMTDVTDSLDRTPLDTFGTRPRPSPARPRAGFWESLITGGVVS